MLWHNGVIHERNVKRSWVTVGCRLWPSGAALWTDDSPLILLSLDGISDMRLNRYAVPQGFEPPVSKHCGTAYLQACH